MQFVEIALTDSIQLYFNASEDTCVKLDRAVPWIYVAGLYAGQVILSIRAWAFCCRKKHVLVILSVAWVANAALAFGLAGYQSFTYKFEIQDIVKEMNQGGLGCIFTGGNTTLLYANLGLMLLYDAVITMFMVAPSYRSFLGNEGTSRIMYTMLVDGVTYYIYIFSKYSQTLFIIIAARILWHYYAIGIGHSFRSYL
ncbi:hypothetical protein BDQ17DRAFT_1038687 [Cyathus striatus]|nr:hypothetical protein BDQ17DRAFT_1038687 [Cyathus striatus]